MTKNLGSSLNEVFKTNNFVEDKDSTTKVLYNEAKFMLRLQFHTIARPGAETWGRGLAADYAVSVEIYHLFSAYTAVSRSVILPMAVLGAERTPTKSILPMAVPGAE